MEDADRTTNPVRSVDREDVGVELEAAVAADGLGAGRRRQQGREDQEKK
jgi:hypothetical protein